MATVLANIGGYSFPFFIIAAATLLSSMSLWVILPSQLDYNDDGEKRARESEKAGKQLEYSSLLKVSVCVTK